jgi:hypothetical protein
MIRTCSAKYELHLPWATVFRRSNQDVTFFKRAFRKLPRQLSPERVPSTYAAHPDFSYYTLLTYWAGFPDKF